MPLVDSFVIQRGERFIARTALAPGGFFFVHLPTVADTDVLLWLVAEKQAYFAELQKYVQLEDIKCYTNLTFLLNAEGVSREIGFYRPIRSGGAGGLSVQLWTA